MNLQAILDAVTFLLKFIDSVFDTEGIYTIANNGHDIGFDSSYYQFITNSGIGIIAKVLERGQSRLKF